MKRIGAILGLAALIVTMTFTTCFAGQSLKIVDSYPKDQQKNTTIENMAVKLTFNNEMGSKESRKANAGCFSITDDKGHKIPIRVFYDPENSKKMMVLADTVKINQNNDLRIQDNTTYTLNISGDLQDNDGNTLGKDDTISFTTLNQKKNTSVYMFMMLIMFGGMFLFSSRQMRKQQEQQGVAKEEPFNPYKEAKKSGKSVEEVIAAHEKEMEKKAKKEARKVHKQNEEDDDDDDYEEDNGNYKVKGPRPIAAAGGKYITGRKALAEARKAEEERLAKRRANAKKKKK